MNRSTVAAAEQFGLGQSVSPTPSQQYFSLQGKLSGPCLFSMGSSSVQAEGAASQNDANY